MGLGDRQAWRFPREPAIGLALNKGHGRGGLAGTAHFSLQLGESVKSQVQGS